MGDGIGKFAVGFEGGANDEAIGEPEVIRKIRERDPAAEEEFGFGTDSANPFEVGDIGGHAGSGAGDDESVGEAAFDRVSRGIGNGPVTERHSVFHVDIRKNQDFRTNLATQAQGFESVTLNDALVSEHGPGVDIDTDERTVAGGAKAKGGAGVVAQDVETDGEFHGLADGASGSGHRRNRLRPNRTFGERDVAEVFDKEGLGAAASVGAGVIDREADEGIQVSAPSRRTGEWPKMDDADEELAAGIKERLHASEKGKGLL